MATFLDQIFSAAQGQTLVVTANERLARYLHTDYDQRMLALGHRAWQRPAILSLEGWLNRCFKDLGEDWRYLQPVAQKRLWEQIIAANVPTTGRELLQVSATAELASQAAELLDSYAVTLENQPLSDDQRAFQRWLRVYREECAEQGWLDRSARNRRVLEALSRRELDLPRSVLLVGFDQLPPLLEELLADDQQNGLKVRILSQEKTDETRPVRVACSDMEQEVEQAARWARLLLEKAAGTIGVVVPDLQQRRPLIERIFRAQIDPAASLLNREEDSSFGLSLGAPLLEQGPVLAALQLLSAGYQVPLEQCCALLRSPYLQKSRREADVCARLEGRLRSFRQPVLRRDRLKHLAREEGASGLSRALDAMELGPRSEQLLPGEWGAFFDQQLQTSGWPGGIPLQSSEYQAVMAWREKLLPQLATLDPFSRPLRRADALSFLRRLALETEFQVEAPTVPLQIVGLLESAGLEFDHLWVMGMNEETFPAPARPNPFLPYRLQVARRMPHADAERELAFSTAVIARLQAASPQTIFSYRLRDGDCELRPTGLIRELELVAPDLSASCDPGALCQQKENVLEECVDQQGSSLTDAEVQGGTAILRDQALCPFRAFAHYRLQARAFDAPDPGIDALTRGQLLHRTLELFWREVVSHEELNRQDSEIRRRLVATSVDGAISHVYEDRPEPKPELIALEAERMNRLVLEWLEQIDSQRAGFSVLGLEEERIVNVGPLQIRTVVDRIDTLEDGRRVVIDYKTGVVKTDLLAGERLLEPQLPIYAVTTTDAPVDGVAFAQLRGGDCRLVGVARTQDLLPGVPPVEKFKSAGRVGLTDWESLMTWWHGQLEELAKAFADGVARVDPISAEQACKYCDLKHLCRISESDRGGA